MATKESSAALKVLEQPGDPSAAADEAAADRPFGSLESMFEEISFGDPADDKAPRRPRFMGKYDELWQLSLADPLTGLANRMTLRAHVERCLDNPTTAVVFIDLNGFKPINDEHGRATGDEILRRVASRLESSVRKGDVVARYGGDEFVVVAAIRDPEELRALAARLAEGIQRPIELPEGTFRLTASVGLAHPGPGDTAATLLGRADTAMYIAKQHAEGGGNYPQS